MDGGRVAVVTGGGRGLGREAALALAKAGFSVAIAARSRVEMEETVALIGDAGGTSMSFKADVSDPGDVVNFMRAVEYKFGTAQVLVNNAGVFEPAREMKDLTDEDLDYCMGINFRGAFMMSRAVIPGMIQKRSGSIINITSGLAEFVIPRLGAYSISKAALNQLTRVLSTELMQYKVRVNAVDPGVMDTGMQERVRLLDILEAGPDVYRIFHDLESTGQLRKPAAIADLIVFLATEESLNITGEVGDADHYAKLGHKLAA